MAILAADAAGYARLMADDEAATLAALDAGRAVFRAAVERHGGRVADTARDSLLAVFETARGAIDAAADAQAEIESAPFAELPGGRLRFRIGIHLGDVVEKEDGTVHGNGVNVALRLQGLAAAGGVMVSDAVRATLSGRSGRAFVDEGVHEVRHIAEPVHVFRLRLGAIDELRRPLVPVRAEPPAPRPRWHWHAWWGGVLALALAVLLGLWLTGQPVPRAGTPGGPRLVPLSLAMPPFAAPGGEASDAEALRRDLLMGLGVAARHVTVLEMPDDAPTAAARREAALAAGLRYVVDGSVHREPGGLAVDLQLVDSGSGAQAWTHHALLAAPPDGRAAERRELLGQLVRGLTVTETRRVLPLPADHLSASELMLRAWADFATGTLPAVLDAERLLDRALLLEPNHVRALITRAVLDDARYAVDPHPEHGRLVTEMDELTGRALALDEREPYAWSARGLALVYLGRWNAAVDAYARALELDPDNRELRADRAWVEIVTGNPQAALPIVDGALALKGAPSPELWRTRCQAELMLGHAPQAITACETTTGLDPNDWIAHLFLVAAYANAGNPGKAAEARRAVERVVPGYTIERLRNYRYSQHPDYARLVEQHWFAGLRAAGMPER